MTEIRAGDLRNRVAVQRRTTSTGTRGQSTEAWATVEYRWARVEALSSREAEKARQLFAESTHQITMRKPTGYTLDLANRIKFESAVYGIGSIQETGERRDDLVLLCSREQ